MTQNEGIKNRNKRNRIRIIKKSHTTQLPAEQQIKPPTATDRNSATPVKSLPGFRTDEGRFDIVIDGVPYLVKAIPFLFNDELRFRIIINNNAEHLFTWDSEIKMLRAIDDDASDLPERLEEAISEKLRGQLKT